MRARETESKYVDMSDMGAFFSQPRNALGAVLGFAVQLCVLAMVGSGCHSFDESVEHSKKTVALDTLLKEGRAKEAVATGEAFVAAYPSDYRGWSMLGWAYLKTGRAKDAGQCFDTAVRINDSWDNAYVGRGAVYREMGELDSAIAQYEKAIALEPNNAEAFASLLVIELMRGNGKEAVAYGEMAWRLRKDHPAIAANLAFAYQLVGNRDKRNWFAKRALEMHYADRDPLVKLMAAKPPVSTASDTVTAH